MVVYLFVAIYLMYVQKFLIKWSCLVSTKDKNFFIWSPTKQIYNTKYVLENRTYKPIIIYGLEHLYSMNTIMAISWDGWYCTNIGNLWEAWKQDNCAIQPLNIEIPISTSSNMHFGNLAFIN
jgi:hypothetical protein